LGGSEVGKTTIAVPDGQIQVNVSQEASSTGQAAFNLPSVSRYQYGLLHNTQSASGLVSTRETTFNMNVLEIITESGAPAEGSSGFDLTVDKGFRNENTYNRSSQTPLSSKLGWLENGNEMGVYFRRVDEGNFALDGRRRLVSATSTAGVSGTDSVSYGLHGLVSHTDRFGRTTAHQYTPSGQLVSTQMESFLLNHVLAPTGARVYSYPAAMPDGADPLITSAGNLKQRTDPVGRVTQLNRSGSDGNVALSATLPGGSDALQTFYGDGLPHTLGGTALPAMTYEYAWGQNSAAQVTQKYTGNPNEKTVREVDSLGRIVRELAPNPAGVGDVEVIYHYDPQTGHLRKITRSNAVATFYEYDELNRIKRVALNVNINDNNDNNDSLDLDGSDRVSEWEYSIGESSDGVVLTTKEYLRRPELGTKLLIRERAESIDGLHSRVKELDLPTAVRSTSVNQGTFTTTWTHPDGTTTVTVESEGLLRSRVHKDANGNTIEGFTYNYSAKRLLGSVTDAGRGTTEYEYFDDGSLAWSLSPSAGSGQPDVFLQYDYSGIGGLSYNNQGMVKKTTLSDGTSTITEVFTPRGELRSRSGALGYPVTYTYDHAGRVKTLATSTGGTNSVVAVTTWNYNDAGLPESKIFPGGSEITYTYHSNGVPHTETQPGGIVKTYGTTPLGQISSIAYAGATTPSVHYTYDVLGRLKTVTDASGTRTQNYDNNTLLPTTLTYSDGIFDEITIQTLYNMRRPWAVGISHSGTLLHGNVLTYDTASRIFSVFGNYAPHVYT
jgi:YD repeat-containing protein